MSTIYNQVIGDWIDSTGKSATSFMTTLDQASAGASAYANLAAKLQACCDAQLRAIQFQTTLVLGGAPLTGPYSTIVDRAALMGLITATGAPYRLSLVGPKASIFAPTNAIVDLSNPLIVALQAAQSAVLGDPYGNANGPFKRGVRQMARGN